jgi:hypothetical protein
VLLWVNRCVHQVNTRIKNLANLYLWVNIYRYYNCIDIIYIEINNKG